MWTAFHGDVDVDSSILSLRVSFKWRHLIDDGAMRIMHQWVASEQTERPNLIFLGKQNIQQRYSTYFPRKERMFALLKLKPFTIFMCLLTLQCDAAFIFSICSCNCGSNKNACPLKSVLNTQWSSLGHT
jgi:hypothetical protein